MLLATETPLPERKHWGRPASARSVLTSAECCGLKWQNSPSRSAPLRIKPGDSVSEPRCSLPAPWHRARSRHLVNPLTLCDTKRARTQGNACARSPPRKHLFWPFACLRVVECSWAVSFFFFFSVQPSRGVLFLQMKCLTQKFITSLSLRGSCKEKEKEYRKKLLAEMGKPDFANKNVSLDSR